MLKYPLHIIFLPIIHTLSLNPIENFQNTLKRPKFSQCEACKIYTGSFKRGMDRTEKGKFEGGDTAWEEAKLGSYANSEIRLVEIQEKICSDVNEGKNECYSIQEEYGDIVEEWWLNLQNKYPDLTKYLCIEKLPYCCPDLHYGSKCLPCPGYPENICSKNGQCAGNGTRKGNGRCICDEGYKGKNCETCAKKYYETQEEQDKIICKLCPRSCHGTCTKFGCEKCAEGWIMTKGGLCLDIDECSAIKSTCKSSQFCVNTEGGFKCRACDVSCDVCSGEGPENCKNCVQGYKMLEGTCVQKMKYKEEPFTYVTKVLIYSMLGTSTCVVYRKSSFVALLLGVIFTAYMTPVEFMLNQV